ncbi:MAG: isoprenylcysteine carboxylmethyltransferase family protein [Gemmataceae bacterium]|nr:isoprenylcysteine carboxylmethyltransferase family protein [Gemmataceae bacterium]
MSATPGWTSRILAALCVLVGVAGQAGFMLFVVLLGLDLLPAREPLPGAWPWAVNLGWLITFGLQHSGMARAGFKRAWARVVPEHLERAAYVALSGLLLAGLSLTWQPIPGEPLWHLPVWVIGVALAGALGTGLICNHFDLLSFFGLSQAWGKEEAAPERLNVSGPYRYVRHPLMSCTLLFLWGQPVMTPTLALLSAGLTGYVLLALPLEERDLVRQFGEAYESYRRRVPALIPWRLPHHPGERGA